MKVKGGSRVERSCFVCRKTDSKENLLRLVVEEEGGAHVVHPDPEQRLPGRGFYIHPTPGCALSKRFTDCFRGVYSRVQGLRRKALMEAGKEPEAVGAFVPGDLLQILEQTLEQGDPDSVLSSGLSNSSGRSRRSDRWQSFRERIFELRVATEALKESARGRGILAKAACKTAKRVESSSSSQKIEGNGKPNRKVRL